MLYMHMYKPIHYILHLFYKNHIVLIAIFANSSFILSTDIVIHLMTEFVHVRACLYACRCKQ